MGNAADPAGFCDHREQKLPLRGREAAKPPGRANKTQHFFNEKSPRAI
jgi:hypothetical protein